jgi:hypothetical protein
LKNNHFFVLIAAETRKYLHAQEGDVKKAGLRQGALQLPGRKRIRQFLDDEAEEKGKPRPEPPTDEDEEMTDANQEPVEGSVVDCGAATFSDETETLNDPQSSSRS